MIADVSPEMLADLAEHFARPVGEAGWTAPELQRPAYDMPRLFRLHLPGFTASRTLVGSDGSVTVGSDIGGFAAVHGDGTATAGTFTGTPMNSQAAEMQAVRIALRHTGEAPVTILMDNTQVLHAVQAMARLGRPYGHFLDREGLGDVAALLKARPLTARHVPDAEGDTNEKRFPSNPLMAAAHRLAWSIRRLRIDGIGLDWQAKAWLREVATAETRRAETLRHRYERFLKRRCA